MSYFHIPVPEGTPVRVYRNLHARCWSVQVKARQPGTNRHHWKVAGHADSLVVDAVAFKVYEKGRQRVRLTGVKNVHAYVLGALVAVDPFDPAPDAAVDLTYNPKRWTGFVPRTLAEQAAPGLSLSPYLYAGRVWLSAGGSCFAEDPHRIAR